MPSKLLLNSTLEASSARTIPTPGQSRCAGRSGPRLLARIIQIAHMLKFEKTARAYNQGATRTHSTAFAQFPGAPPPALDGRKSVFRWQVFADKAAEALMGAVMFGDSLRVPQKFLKRVALFSRRPAQRDSRSISEI